jgi:hypothetical protein
MSDKKSNSARQDYSSRMLIPLDGDPVMDLLSKAGFHLASGYQRVVIGARGPYLEFTSEQVQIGNLHVPDTQLYRVSADYVYYVEYRSNCKADVKIYHQKKRVDYADYVPGMFYISPFELTRRDGSQLISALKSAEARVSNKQASLQF